LTVDYTLGCSGIYSLIFESAKKLLLYLKITLEKVLVFFRAIFLCRQKVEILTENAYIKKYEKIDLHRSNFL